MLVIDNFAGGGGTSLGIEKALGRPVDIALNHDAEAIAMHRLNHPATIHFRRDIWSVNPADVAQRGPISLAWFSPDCTHFSVAKGAAPLRPEHRRSRDLAWAVILWARLARPSVIMLENVQEFMGWCPLLPNGLPDKSRDGETFRSWLAALSSEGYSFEWRMLRGCDYGSPTFRNRFFLVARRDGLPIVWPEPTHGPGLRPFRVAADCMDWSIPVHSIFLPRDQARRLRVRRPLADKTLARIARGVRRYVLEAAQPFIIPVTHGGDRRTHSIAEPLRTITTAKRGELALVSAHMAQHNTRMTGHACTEPVSTIVSRGSNQALVTSLLTREFGASTGQALDRPMATVMPGGGGKTSLVSACLTNFHGSNTNGGAGDLRRPINAIMAQGQHKGLVAAFLEKYCDPSPRSRPSEESPAASERARRGLVTIDAAEYQLTDIGMRMLSARELYRAQGFPDTYRIAFDFNGKPLTKEAQIRMCGNSVCPDVAEALVAANVRPSPPP